jgi:hypothetical protein
MYCSSCGLAVAETLSYCNHCGARLNASNKNEVAVSREVKPELLVSAMVATFVLGLLVITALIGVMKSVLGLESGQILAFAALSFLVMLSLEGVFLHLLFRRNGRAEKRDRTESLPEQTTKELAEPQMQALREPLSSVTDHTTRAFEPIYTDRDRST